MSKTSQQREAKAQVNRLSPELNEFLHMLKALEGQATEAPAPR